MSPGFGYLLTLALLPQLILVGVALACAVIALVRPAERADLYRWLACIGLLGAVAACGFELFAMRLNRNGVAFEVWSGGLTVDHFSIFITITACSFALIACLLSDTYLRRIPTRAAAFSALVLITTTATAALASERELTTFVVSLVLLLFGLVAITALLKTDPRGAQTAWSLLKWGGVATALVVYGAAVLYGVTGSTVLSAVGATVHRSSGITAIGITLVLVGMTFFVGGFPLRDWLTSTSEGVPPVAAGFVIAMATTAGATGTVRLTVSGLGGSVPAWTWLLSALAVIAVVQAALLAVRARDIRQLITAIVTSQAGLLFVAIISFGQGASGVPARGTTALLFAVFAFGLAVLAAFAVLSMLQTAGLSAAVTAYRGLAHRSAPTALLLSLALTTLAGVPPLAGFIARLFIVESAMDAGYGWVAVIALVAAVVTAIPVVRLIAAMYAEVGDEIPFTLGATPRLGRMVATFCCIGGAALTVLAQPLLLLAGAGAGPLP